MDKRCSWATTSFIIAYHDKEWGVPVHDETRLFEFLILEGAQAGLSWETVLRKRDNYRAAFDVFNPVKVAKYDKRKIDSIAERCGNYSQPSEDQLGGYKCDRVSRSPERVWEFRLTTSGALSTASPAPQTRPADRATTPVSDALSKDLLKRGFKFVGSTICYSFMQAVAWSTIMTRPVFAIVN